MKIVFKTIGIMLWLVAMMLGTTFGVHLISYPDTLANILGVLVIALVMGVNLALIQTAISYNKEEE